MTHANHTARADFANQRDFAWYVTAGADSLLDALADGDTDLAERITWNLLRQATYVKAEAEADGVRGRR